MRKIRIDVTMTKSEAQITRERAAETGVTPSEYIRIRTDNVFTNGKPESLPEKTERIPAFFNTMTVKKIDEFAQKHGFSRSRAVNLAFTPSLQEHNQNGNTNTTENTDQ